VTNLVSFAIASKKITREREAKGQRDRCEMELKGQILHYDLEIQILTLYRKVIFSLLYKNTLNSRTISF
jgi:hypothetical protein